MALGDSGWGVVSPAPKAIPQRETRISGGWGSAWEDLASGMDQKTCTFEDGN